MKEGEKENVAEDLDLDIEVLDGREEILVASAGCTCSGHRGPSVKIVSVPE
jgi:hypothetical protein